MIKVVQCTRQIHEKEKGFPSFSHSPYQNFAFMPMYN